jgi:hypothetical protein
MLSARSFTVRFRKRSEDKVKPTLRKMRGNRRLVRLESVIQNDNLDND